MKLYLDENNSITLSDTGKLASMINIAMREGREFIINTFSPGDVIEIEEGSVM